MGKRIFEINANVTYQIELDDAVIDVVDDEWRSVLYDLYTPEDIAKMVGGCLLRGWTLSGMDGWADQPETNARIVDYIDYETESVKEIK
jgi:hypothetical protein